MVVKNVQKSVHMKKLMFEKRHQIQKPIMCQSMHVCRGLCQHRRSFSNKLYKYVRKKIIYLRY